MDESKPQNAYRLLVEHAAEAEDHTASAIAELVGLYVDDEDVSHMLLPALQSNVAAWRRNAIPGDVTPQTQAGHTMVEAAEVQDLLIKLETYEDRDYDEMRQDEALELASEIGDVVVALSGVPNMLGMAFESCVAQALDKNGARDWDSWTSGEHR